MALEGIDADSDDIVITTGSQQAVDIITELFIDPGDVILAEAPTYVGSLSIFATYQADVQQVAIDADGVIPEALEETISQLERSGRTIKFFYCLKLDLRLILNDSKLANSIIFMNHGISQCICWETPLI